MDKKINNKIMNGIKKEKQINECMHEKSKTNG